MNDKMLENNRLYQILEHKNLFRTLSKTYERPSQSRVSDMRMKFNQTIQETFVSTNIPRHKQIHTAIQSNRNRSEKEIQNLEVIKIQESIPSHIHKKYSGKIFTGLLQNHSKTMPIHLQFQNQLSQTQFGRDCHTTWNSKSNLSEPILLKPNFRKNQEFKLKSCQYRERLDYDSPSDQVEFSTLQLRKKLSVDQYGRYRKWKASIQRESNQQLIIQGQGTTNVTKRATTLSKHSKFSQEGMKNRLQMIRNRKY